MHFEIVHQQVLEGVPSASGIVRYNGFYYVIGDDSPFLFKLNHQFEVISRYPIYTNVEKLENDRLAKKDKPDFEALEMVSENELIGLGSGSRSPERDEFLRITMNDPLQVKKYRLTFFYQKLKRLKVMEDSELNIEAVAYTNEVLYLFNRKKNIVFRTDYHAFIYALENNWDPPTIDSFEYKLPEIDGIEAGFSGATASRDGKTLFVTCSVENTGNAYDDGDILGSFIGALSLEESEEPGKPIKWTSIKNPGKPLKVESIAVEGEITERQVEVVLVTDSDGEQSLILRGKLKW